MPIDPAKVAVGDCYETVTKQQRKVVDIVSTPNGVRVRYFSRGGNVQNAWDWAGSKTNPPLLDKFAEDVDAVIACPAAAPPPGFDQHGQRSPIRVWYLDTTKYPYSCGGRVTFRRSPEVADIWNGDQLTDPTVAGAPIYTVSQVWLTDTEIQMVLK
jgi:hypothetical protein